MDSRHRSPLHPPPSQFPPGYPDVETRRKCLALVIATAEKYDIPPCHITAHVRCQTADKARREVWAVMYRDLGIKRRWIAIAFGRSLRRVRRSVIGV